MYFRATSSILALLATATPALADVTPAEVWQTWIDYYKVSGYTVTEGSRQEEGDSLKLSDVSFTVDQPDMDMAFTIPEITLTSAGDGTVNTTMSDQTAGTVVTNAEGKEINVAFTLAHPGAQVTSSGMAGDLTSTSKFPTLTLSIDEVKAPEATYDDVFKATLADVALTEHVVQGEPLKVDYDLTAGKSELALNLNTKDEAGKDVKVNAAWTLDTLTSKGSGEFPPNMAGNENVAAILREGMKFAGNLQVGPNNLVADVAATGEDGAPMTSSVKADSKGSSGELGMTVDGLNYQIDSDATTVEMTSSDMPFPVTYGIDSSTAVLQFPISKKDEPQPFKVTYSIAGLTLGDAIWDLFDKDKVLPRDPATLDLDLTGNLRVKEDLLDPAVMEAAAAGEGQTTATPDASATDAPATDAPATDAPATDAPATDAPATDAPATDAPATDAPATAGEETATAAETPAPAPFEPVDFTINQFAVKAAGVDLTASGNLAASDAAGMQAPVGKITAKGTGINTLLDRLTQIGVVPAEQVSGFRMMLAMFTKPGEGEDTLNMDIEFREGGSIFANGQQVK